MRNAGQSHGAGGDPCKKWIVKVLPEALASEVPDLYTPSRFHSGWIARRLGWCRTVTRVGISYGDGAQVKAGAAREIEDETWERVAKKLFGLRTDMNEQTTVSRSTIKYRG
jgi:hypothetical protein